MRHIDFAECRVRGELPEDVGQSMTFISVEMIDEVLHASLRTGTGAEGL